MTIRKKQLTKALLILSAVFISNCFAGKVLESTHAGNTLFLSKSTLNHADVYLATMQTQLASGYINCAVKVYGDALVEKVYCDGATKEARGGIHRIRDYRIVKGREWLFITTRKKTEGDITRHCALDSDRQLQNCFSMPFLDPHDFLLTPNGDRIFMFYEPRLDEKRWISGIPLDLVLRRVNSHDEVIWTWSSAKHFNVAYPADAKKNWFSRKVRWLKEVRTAVMTSLGVSGDRPFCVNVIGTHCANPHYIDYMHANSLEWDADGGIIVSGRDINTIFKINVSTGEVAWRIGGYHSEKSDFTVLDDPLDGFSYQHSARILTNGNLLLFDNGNDRLDKKTRVVEYALDREKKIATYLWSHNAPDDFPFRRCCGAVQRLGNGHTFIAWGGWEMGRHDRESILVAEEIDKTGKVVAEIRSTVESLPYRVWKK